MWIKCDKNAINADLVKCIDIFGKTIRFMDQKPTNRGGDAFTTCLGTITFETEGEAKSRYEEIIEQLVALR